MVFEGGANRTVFSCGVMDAFLKEGLMPDYLIGVSAGIAYGVSYLSGQKGRNIEVVENYIADKRYMGMRHLFNRKEKAYFNTKFVFEEVPNELIPFDYDAFAAYPGKVEAAVTNIHTGKAEYVEVPRGRDMRDTLVASCSLPILFQPVKLGRHYYLDGGIADSIPYEHALAEGCDRLIVVLTRERGYSRAERYNECMARLQELEQEGKIFVIAPESTYGVGRTTTDVIKLRRLYDEGYELTEKRMQELRAYLG